MKQNYIKKIWRMMIGNISHSTLLAMLVLLLASSTSSAYDFESGGLNYHILSEQNRTVEVARNYDYEISGKIVIPRKVTYRSKTYTVTAIGEEAFMSCADMNNVTIPNTVTSIGEWAFWLCTGLTNVELPNSITSIGENAFGYCDHLSYVTFSESLISIGDYSFLGCTGLRSLAIPNSVTSIGQGAFANCGGLSSVTISRSVTSIGRCVFSDSENLEYINVDPENQYFTSVDGVLYNKERTVLLCFPGARTVAIIPDLVTSIGESAFYGCSKLKTVMLPNSVADIGDNAFHSCFKLHSITIPNSVTTIGNKAFEYCGLYGMTIPNSVTSIGASAFSNCSQMFSLTIPNSVTSIGYKAFDECNGLQNIYVQCEIPLLCDPGFPEMVVKEALLHIPVGTLSAYKCVYPWKDFLNIVEMESGGIDGAVIDSEGELFISVNGGILCIGGAGHGEGVTVYDMRGRTVYTGTSHNVEIHCPGFYIVKVGSRIAKISI